MTEYSKMLKGSLAMAILMIFSALQAEANQLECPKKYVTKQDNRQKTGKYWIFSVPTESSRRILEDSDVWETYVATSAKRAHDFECSFTYHEKKIMSSYCTNTLGNRWNPTPRESDYRNTWEASLPSEAESNEMSGYVVDKDGSYKIVYVCSNDSCDAIFLDKEKKRFIVSPHFSYDIYWRVEMGGESINSWNRSNDTVGYSSKIYVLRNGTLPDERGELGIEAISIYPFFDAGSQSYFLLAREAENGITCSYKGGISPSL